jgi:hypothetical protein
MNFIELSLAVIPFIFGTTFEHYVKKHKWIKSISYYIGFIFIGVFIGNYLPHSKEKDIIPAINSNNGTISVNQQNGVTAQTYIKNEFPEPEFLLKTISENVNENNAFKTTISLNIKSKTALKSLTLCAKCNTPIKIDVFPIPDRAGSYGKGISNGMPCVGTTAAWGEYSIVVFTKTCLFPRKRPVIPI